MSIVHDSGHALLRADGFQPAGHTLQRAHHHQHVFGLLSQHHGGTIDGQQVAHIELADELHAYLTSVDVQVHALEMALNETGLEVGHRPGGVGLHRGLRVLHHKETVLVVGIGDGKGTLGQLVEEHLLGIAVVLERLVVVQMVAGQVGEDASPELQTSYAVLGNGVARAFHEAVLAACIHHALQQTVQLYGVWRGVAGRHGLILYVVAHGRKQSALIAQPTEHII